MKYITRTVWILSFVSLLNDVSSELLYPVMPLFLSSIGFSSVYIGLLEGIAEAVAGLSKGYFGQWSDATGRRMPFVGIGYLMSAISKPMMAVFTFPLWIFGARTADRLGKGVRTAARDAMLADECTPANRAKVFGFHKSMDTIGATLGPIVALIFLSYFPNEYKKLFLLAFFPALAGTLLTLLVKERRKDSHVKHRKAHKSFSFGYIKTASTNYKKIVLGFLLFALFNSSDIFLLMKIKESGLNDQHVIGLYILFNLVFAMSAFPIGHLADAIGLKKTFMLGITLFTVVYLGFGLSSSFEAYIVLLVLYGFYSACNEGVAKALISKVVNKKETATALGTFAGLNSIVTLLASTLAGVIWKFVTPNAVFLFSAVGCFFVLLYFKFIPMNESEVEV